MAASAALKRASLLLLACAAALIGAGRGSAQAAEAASGFYLLGLKTAMAGYLPPPGTYVQSLTYYYKGDTDNIVPFSGRLVAGLDGSAILEAGIVTWVAPHKVFGGNIGVGVIVPYGKKVADANIELSILQTPIAFGVSDDKTAYGDPAGLATIGWHAGNWHWTLNALLNVPVGFWERGRLANIGFNRWATDLSASATWFDPKSGIELSGTIGATFNWENQATDYKSGTEGHLELALMQHVGKNFSFGVAGYHYHQLTGDSGLGARLGPFKGRVSAVGPMLTYSFTVGKTPVSTSLSWLHEFDAENRLEGDAALFDVVVPLGH